MIYHSIILNFGPSDSLPAELVDLISLSYPPPLHPGRAAGLYSSRTSLLGNLRKIHPEAEFKDLALKGHGELEHYPDLCLSLSHSAHAGASALGRKEDYLSLGIDIEPLDRLVKENIIQRVTTSHDLKLSNRELWCLKEAIYKCVSNSQLFSGTLEFKDMQIRETNWIHSPSGLQGEWKLWQELDHQVALATLKNQNS